MYFYLKINREDNYSFYNIQQWIDIISYTEKPIIYFICDKEDLQQKVIENINNRGIDYSFLKSIKNKPEIEEIIENVCEPYWTNAGYAHMTTFCHAKKLGVNEFWNIDADDTFFCVYPYTGAQILCEIRESSRTNGIGCFSLDMWRSREKGKHWSFGVTYTSCAETDWIECALLHCKDREWKCNFNYTLNLDSYFTYLREINAASIETYYIENMRFIHYSDDLIRQPFSSGLCQWKNERLYYPILQYCWNDECGDIPIADDVIRIDTTTTDEEARRTFIYSTGQYNLFSKYEYSDGKKYKSRALILLTNEISDDSMIVQIMKEFRSIGVEIHIYAKRGYDLNFYIKNKFAISYLEDLRDHLINARDIIICTMKGMEYVRNVGNSILLAEDGLNGNKYKTKKVYCLNEYFANTKFKEDFWIEYKENVKCYATKKDEDKIIELRLLVIIKHAFFRCMDHIDFSEKWFENFIEQNHDKLRYGSQEEFEDIIYNASVDEIYSNADRYIKYDVALPLYFEALYKYDPELLFEMTEEKFSYLHSMYYYKALYLYAWGITNEALILLYQYFRLIRTGAYVYSLDKYMKKMIDLLKSDWHFPIHIIDKNKKIVIYGAGYYGKRMIYEAQKIGYNDLAFIIDREYKKKSKVFGIDVLSIEEGKNIDFDYIVISIVDKEINRTIKNELIRNMIPEQKIISVDDY